MQRALGRVSFLAVAALAASVVSAPTAGAVVIAPPTTPPPATSPSPSPTPRPTPKPTPKPTPRALTKCQIAARAKNTTPSKPFYRAATKFGMRDGGPKSINHVREAQYRLRWAKVYKGSVTGSYGPATRRAVRTFQSKNCLAQTGNLNVQSWAVLIQRTVRFRSSIPTVCRGEGWHSCYDRASHQDFLFKNGKMWNVWLVRGGMYSTQTRTGNFKVTARYVEKESSLYHVKMYYFMPHSGGEGQHGSGFMVDPWVGHSHGCINMYIKDAKVLFNLTRNQPLRVTVYGAWD